MKDKEAFWGKVLGWALTLGAALYVLATHWNKLTHP
jgi:hypothetical protein